MIEKPLISIIIPVYNREGLIVETLESIIQQTYKSWECIVVDDNSTDETFSVVQNFEKLDERIKIVKRPSHLNKGANSCRNYGFKYAKGQYIKWYDSDDLMLPKHLEIALDKLLFLNLDFVVTDSVNFDHNTKKQLNKPYEDHKRICLINAENFAYGKIGWITDDFLGKKDLLKNITFNENITDGDEYNFFVKYLHYTVNGEFINEILNLRRVHDESISVVNRKNNYKNILAKIQFQTAKDLIPLNNKILINWFLSQYMHFAYEIALKKRKIPYLKEAFVLICTNLSIYRGVLFGTALLSSYFFKKGFKIIKMARI